MDTTANKRIHMYSLIRKSAVLLSVLTLISVSSASADRNTAPLILMDTGNFKFPENDPNPTSAELSGTGVSTHLGAIVSTGVFEKVDRPSGGFKGKIEGTATTAPPVPPPDETATATPNETASATSKEGSITYRLSAEFRPDASGIFFGVGTYRIIGGTGAFEGARGFGEFIGLADFARKNYNCFLRGTISY
jgi:hypothetical protein